MTKQDHHQRTGGAAELKAAGFIPQRQPGKVTLRCKAPGGRLTADRLEAIAAVARSYGSGIVHLSVRQSPEIVGVDVDSLDAAVQQLAAAGQEIASGGKRCRVTVACAGCETNPSGLTDTQRLSQLVTERFFGIETPHKFKTVFGGCPSDCVRARCTDLGFGGMVEPALASESCTRCGVCARACPEGALTWEPDTSPALDLTRCVSCGRCLRACRAGALTAKRTGHGVYAGGKHGRHPHTSYPVAQFVSDEGTLEVVATTLDWYREHGTPGERMGETLDRVGLTSYRRALRSVVGEGLLMQADLQQPKWRRLYPRGIPEAFPEYEEV